MTILEAIGNDECWCQKVYEENLLLHCGSLYCKKCHYVFTVPISVSFIDKNLYVYKEGKWVLLNE